MSDGLVCPRSQTRLRYLGHSRVISVPSPGQTTRWHEGFQHSPLTFLALPPRRCNAIQVYRARTKSCYHRQPIRSRYHDPTIPLFHVPNPPLHSTHHPIRSQSNLEQTLHPLRNHIPSSKRQHAQNDDCTLSLGFRDILFGAC